MLLLLAGCGVELEHGLDERQANQAVTLLAGSGISADKVAGDGPASTYTIVVPREDAARAFRLLEDHDLPRQGQKGLAETFADSSLLPSPIEDQARYAAALQAELERTLEGLPHVTSARVHLALPVDDPLSGAPAARPTGSVLLKVHGKMQLATAEIARLVAGAVPELRPEDVSVVVAPLAAESDPPALDRLGPVAVARGSRTTVATLAASGLVMILLLGLGLVVAALRLGRLRRRVSELERRS